MSVEKKHQLKEYMKKYGYNRYHNHAVYLKTFILINLL